WEPFWGFAVVLALGVILLDGLATWLEVRAALARGRPLPALALNLRVAAHARTLGAAGLLVLAVGGAGIVAGAGLLGHAVAFLGYVAAALAAHAAATALVARRAGLPPGAGEAPREIASAWFVQGGLTALALAVAASAMPDVLASPAFAPLLALAVAASCWGAWKLARPATAAAA
ncbi:MAG TPA: hypothetical protein VM889_01610, partial [Candidatus Thermoplasmatota archaeon]|nr:hypothetical protein [Candidatus Thermoplasmatota archaeon]